MSESQNPPPSPLHSADPKATLTFSRVLYQGWECESASNLGSDAILVQLGGHVLPISRA